MGASVEVVEGQQWEVGRASSRNSAWDQSLHGGGGGFSSGKQVLCLFSELG